jgi:predicted alpha/beta hydrolase family esterase
MKNQIMIIGGGRTYKDREQMMQNFMKFDVDMEYKARSWKDWLSWSLEGKYEFITMKRPLVDNADYAVWKIMFEKYLVKLNSENLTFISHSLGTIFILKYLVENGFSKKIKQLHLVSPIVSNDFQPVDDEENTGTFTFDILKISEVKKYVDDLHIWHSTDDTMCTYKNAEYIKQEIPESTLHTFSDRGHFLQSTFWELFDVLRK